MDWIDPKYKLPPKGTRVLLCILDQRKNIDMEFIHIGHRVDDIYDWRDDNDLNLLGKDRIITGWMFLPDTPRNKERIIDNKENKCLI